MKEEYCPKCGGVLVDGECLNCNYKKRNGLFWTTIIAIIIVLAVASLLIFRTAKNKDYQNKYDRVVDLILSAAVDAEKACNITVDVWHDSIWETDNPDTSKYTKDESGNFHKDFNDSLSSLYNSNYYLNIYNDATEKDYEIKALMKELNDPPSKYEKGYDALLELYDKHCQFYNLAFQSTESYETFTEKFNIIDEEIMKSYKIADVYSSN